MTRRQLLARGRGCLGAAALASLLRADNAVEAKSASAANPGLPNLPHFAGAAKRVIYLFMAGGPSHIDMFDYKPPLRKLHGTELPESVRKGQRLTGMSSGQSTFPCVARMFKFGRYGERGTWINHDPAVTYINTGTQQLGRPSMGSCLSYGLGSPNESLPAYVTFISVGASPGQALFSRLWEIGFLPSQHQGVQFRSGLPTSVIRKLKRGSRNTRWLTECKRRCPT